MKGNILNILSMIGGKTPEGIVAMLIALMAFGAIPVNLPLAGIAAGAVGVGGIMRYFENRANIKYKDGKNPTIKVEPPNRGGHSNIVMLWLMMVMMIVFIATMIQGCLGEHPLLKKDTLAAAVEIASPYIFPADGEKCQSIAIYPGYELDFSSAMDTGNAGDLYHGFGGIIGGCGKYGRISCFYLDSSEEKVVCREVEVLRTE